MLRDYYDLDPNKWARCPECKYNKEIEYFRKINRRQRSLLIKKNQLNTNLQNKLDILNHFSSISLNLVIKNSNKINQLMREKTILQKILEDSWDQLEREKEERRKNFAWSLSLQQILNSKNQQIFDLQRELEDRSEISVSEYNKLKDDLILSDDLCQDLKKSNDELGRKKSELENQLSEQPAHFQSLENENQALKKTTETHQQVQNDWQKTENSNQKQSEKEFAERLNEELQLGLDSNPTLCQIITKIKKLLSKPPVINNENIGGEDLKIIKEIDWQTLSRILSPGNISEEVKQGVKENNSYQEWNSVKEEALTKHFFQKNEQLKFINQEKNGLINRAKNQRLVWSLLLVISLLGIGILTKKMKKVKSENKSYRQNYQSIKEENC